MLLNRPRELAECMNSFFIWKVKNLIENLEPSNSDPLSNLRQLMSNRKCAFKLQPVHPDKVEKMISELKNSGSVGLDYIDTKVIKLVKEEIVPTITHILNLSIVNSKFPVQFKKAKVVPLHKSGDRFNPKNFRPVAILPIFSKLFERAVFSQMIEYLESNKILHPSHLDFRVNHSTTTALLQMYDMWVEAMDRGEATGVCFLDMSAAFDLVSHSVLLDKLSLYGFDCASIAWIKSYLSDRQQAVCIDGTCSKLLPLSVGVPQGSIIGPLLYIIFTNDLPESIHKHLPEQQHPPPQDSHGQHSYNLSCHSCGSICCFADDSSLSFSNSAAGTISEVLAERYSTISEYMGCHQLKLNSDKTHLLLLRSDAARRSRPDFHVTLNTQSEVIQPSQSEKLLGGIISQNLKFTDHVQDNDHSMLKILNNRLNALKKVSHAASFKSRKMIANGVITSRLIYLIPLWSGCEKYLINSLQIVQNKAARLVTKCGRMTPVKSILSQCGWLSVAHLSVYHSLVLVFKILATKSPQYLFDKLSGTRGETHYKTRYILSQSRDKMITLGSDSQAEGELARRSFVYRCSAQWNSLPVELREASNLKIFKPKLRKWVLENVPIK